MGKSRTLKAESRNERSEGCEIVRARRTVNLLPVANRRYSRLPVGATVQRRRAFCEMLGGVPLRSLGRSRRLRDRARGNLSGHRPGLSGYIRVNPAKKILRMLHPEAKSEVSGWFYAGYSRVRCQDAAHGIGGKRKHLSADGLFERMAT